ncbi:Protein VAPYRIN [Linum perenne]
MDRLIKLEPSNIAAIRIDPSGKNCSGELTLRNVMYTMPVAFRIQALNRSRYSIKPQSGVISPLAVQTIEITYLLPPDLSLPEKFPHSDDSFLLHSVVVPGAAVKDLESVPNDWFTARKKQVFQDSGLKVMFVGGPVLARMVGDGAAVADLREVLERTSTVDHHGEPLLHVAIARGRADLVQLLLEFGADVGSRGGSGSTPLEVASGSGESLIFELLLARGACTERSENSSWGPIHLAAGGGHVDVLRLLLTKGVNVDSLTKDGNTALHIAVEKRRRDCVRLLLSGGARAHVRNGRDGDTPLHVAARIGDEGTVRVLLSKGGANKAVRNVSGQTAYDVAVENGHARLFDALKLGDSLCAAARKGDAREIQKLTEGGASVNGRDQHGWTALHRAAFKGKIEAARILIEKGIDVDSKDEDGYTALHCAVEAGQTDVIELLVKKNVDVEARTNKGVSALQIAESLHYVGITRVLINGGATREDGNAPVAFKKVLMSARKEGEKPPVKRRPARTRHDRPAAAAVAVL